VQTWPSLQRASAASPEPAALCTTLRRALTAGRNNVVTCLVLHMH
jgi:hypothetical protein